MDSKNIKILIVILIIITIILVLLLLLLNLRNSDINQSQISIGDPGEEIDFSTIQTIKVTEKIDYYTVRNCINNYLNFLNKQSSSYYIGNELDEDMQKEYIYNILSQEYINNNNIKKDKVLNYIQTFDEYRIFIPLKMNVLEKENVKKYVAYGVMQNLDNEYIEDICIVVNLDYKNKTYSIEPINEKVNNIDELELINENISINENGYNSYVEQKITNQYIVNEYFSLYKRLALSKPEYIYNIMPSEYREKRYGNVSEFQKYVNNNKDEISKINLKQYLVNNYDDHIEYVGKDQFGNLYIFDEYENQTIYVKLDTYTINNDKFIEEYEKASEEKKVQMNIDKFIQMINRHDYTSSYNCISDGFKNNYFDMQEKFENYIKNNFFSYNKFEFKNFEKKGSNVYVYSVVLTDLIGENTETKEINIIMQLNDNLDFEMSFAM